MKNLFRLGTFALFAGVFVASAMLAPSTAEAQYAQSPVFARSSPSSLLGVAGGVVINSGVQKLDNVQECTVYADNSAGGSTRALNINFLGPDQSTIVYQQAITVAIAGRALVPITPSSAGTPPTGVTVIPTRPAMFMSFQLAAGGAAAGSLAWYCR